MDPATGEHEIGPSTSLYACVHIYTHHGARIFFTKLMDMYIRNFFFVFVFVFS